MSAILTPIITLRIILTFCCLVPGECFVECSEHSNDLPHEYTRLTSLSFSIVVRKLGAENDVTSPLFFDTFSNLMADANTRH